jgi:hypothetical protein
LIDSFVCAEIPDPVADPLGYALVAEFMMHGPCGTDNPKCPCITTRNVLTTDAQNSSLDRHNG